MNLIDKTLSQLIVLLRNKDINHNELYSFFNKRINKYDNRLNCFITRKVNQYSRLQEGLFCGIPIAIKDNFNTKNIKTTAGSKVLENYIPPYSATVVEKLLKNGAAILGKTNLDSWAHGSSTETSDFGVTKNPHDLKRVSGGSSGGSAASVASYLAPAAIGTETAGSIRQPSAWCGVVGFKPTYGRVSRYGVVAMGSSWDCPGAITRSVKDSAIILQAIAGKDKYDATSLDEPVPDYVREMKDKKTFTIGVSDDYFENVDKEIVEKVRTSINIFKKLGHKIKKVKLMNPKYAVSVYMILQRSEVSSNLARYDGIRFGNNRRLFNEEAEKRIMLGAYSLSRGYYDQYYKKAQKVRRIITNDFKRIFKEVDFIVAPTTPKPALNIGEWEKYPFFGEAMDILCEPAAAAGIPAINLPIGVSRQGLPIGMQIMGRFLEETNILNISYQFEQETDFFGIIKTPVKFL